MIDLDELERLAHNATPGPWKVSDDGYNDIEDAGGASLLWGDYWDWGVANKSDADFITAANPSVILELIRMVTERDADKFFADAPDPRDELIERLQAENAELRRDAERFSWYFSDADKGGEFLMKYMEGIREHWSLNMWREAIDAARQQKG